MSPHTHTTTTEKLTVPSPKTPFVRGSPVLSYLFRTYSYGAEAWTSEPCLWVGKDSFFFPFQSLAPLFIPWSVQLRLVINTAAGTWAWLLGCRASVWTSERAVCSGTDCSAHCFRALLSCLQSIRLRQVPGLGEIVTQVTKELAGAGPGTKEAGQSCGVQTSAFVQS